MSWICRKIQQKLLISYLYSSRKLVIIWSKPERSIGSFFSSRKESTLVLSPMNWISSRHWRYGVLFEHLRISCFTKGRSFPLRLHSNIDPKLRLVISVLIQKNTMLVFCSANRMSSTFPKMTSFTTRKKVTFRDYLRYVIHMSNIPQLTMSPNLLLIVGSPSPKKIKNILCE